MQSLPTTSTKPYSAIGVPVCEPILPQPSPSILTRIGFALFGGEVPSANSIEGTALVYCKGQTNLSIKFQEGQPEIQQPSETPAGSPRQEDISVFIRIPHRDKIESDDAFQKRSSAFWKDLEDLVEENRHVATITLENASIYDVASLRQVLTCPNRNHIEPADLLTRLHVSFADGQTALMSKAFFIAFMGVQKECVDLGTVDSPLPICVDKPIFDAAVSALLRGTLVFDATASNVCDFLNKMSDDNKKRLDAALFQNKRELFALPIESRERFEAECALYGMVLCEEFKDFLANRQVAYIRQLVVAHCTGEVKASYEELSAYELLMCQAANEQLDLSRSKVDDRVFPLIKECFPMLQILNLARTRVVKIDFSALPPGLKKLSLNNCSLANFTPASEASLNLESLDLSDCRDFSRRLASEISQMTSLTRLNLSHAKGASNGPISDLSIQTIVKSCRGLESISLNGIGVTAQTIRLIANLKNLKTVSLIGCPKVDKTAIVPLVCKWPSVKVAFSPPPAEGPFSLIENYINE